MATERLRKRLGNEYNGGENNAEVNENFCLIGTPLPSISNRKEDVNEYKPEWQQEVYDDQGRRRFHGAFTGGWSAGYYNTVGSKEGWTPTSFRSSRKDKEKQVRNEKEYGEKKTTAEDFMDEEDLEDFRERRGELKVNDSINSLNNSQSDPLSRILGLEQNLEHIHSSQESTSNISPQQSSIGTRLLQRMGWKSGQGLGPWLTIDRLVRLSSIFGLQGKLKSSKEDKAKTFPPPDTPLVQSVPNRIGSQGLGWQNFDKPATLSELLKKRHDSEQNENDSRKERRGGFGIGALEQDSDGEDEIYNSGLQVEDSTLVSRSRKGNEKADNGNKRIANHTSFNKEENDGKSNAWNNGRPMISGFVLSLNPLKEDNCSEAPLVPKDWQPDPQRVWGTISTSSNSEMHPNTGIQLGSRERASMFGEARIPGPPPLISDYLSVKDQERLQRFKAGNDQETSFVIPKIDGNVAKAALQGFIPFGNDLDKQGRYRAYLKSQIDHSFQHLHPDNGQTQEEFERELREFSKSATIFKPMNTMMASRFESSSAFERNDAKQLAPGLFQPSPVPLAYKEEKEEAKEVQKQKEDLIDQEFESLTPFQRNAKMGLFGPNTTRETKKWVPVRLLCKRLNVPLPYPDEMMAMMEDKTGKGKGEEMFDEFGESKGKRFNQVTNVNARWESSKRELQRLAANRSWEVQEGNEKSSLMAGSEIENNDDNTKFDLANVGLGAIKDTMEDEYVKPPLRIFKEIFAEDEDSVTDSQTVEEQPTDSQSDTPPTPASLPRLLFKPRKRSEIEDGEQTSVKKKKVEKSKVKGRLTFNMEDEEDDTELDNNFQRKKDRPKQSRLKASDLF